MKKKILIGLVITLSFALTGCDFIDRVKSMVGLGSNEVTVEQESTNGVEPGETEILEGEEPEETTETTEEPDIVTEAKEVTKGQAITYFNEMKTVPTKLQTETETIIVPISEEEINKELDKKSIEKLEFTPTEYIEVIEKSGDTGYYVFTLNSEQIEKYWEKVEPLKVEKDKILVELRPEITPDQLYNSDLLGADLYPYLQDNTLNTSSIIGTYLLSEDKKIVVLRYATIMECTGYTIIIVNKDPRLNTKVELPKISEDITEANYEDKYTEYFDLENSAIQNNVDILVYALPLSVMEEAPDKEEIKQEETSEDGLPVEEEQEEEVKVGTELGEDKVETPERKLMFKEKFPSLFEFKYEKRKDLEGEKGLLGDDSRGTVEIPEASESMYNEYYDNREVENVQGPSDPANTDTRPNNVFNKPVEDINTDEGNVTVKVNGKTFEVGTPIDGGSTFLEKVSDKELLFKITEGVKVRALLGNKKKFDKVARNYKGFDKNYTLVSIDKNHETYDVNGSTFEYYNVTLKEKSSENIVERVALARYQVNGTDVVLIVESTDGDGSILVKDYKDILINIALSGIK